ncbi:MAG: AAA family ATPase [Phycisphaerae bacterium]|nr:AAA family ATPase [Phycisphaerae bacterium]
MHIVELRAENVKRLRAVRITPEGRLVTLTGRNGQGKSSVLDSIAYALAGKGVQPAAPVRRGEERAEVVLKLDDGKTVRRTWNANGGTALAVESPDGARYPTPQKLLDELVGTLSFDPLAFTRLHPRDQAATLKQLAGIDLTALDDSRAANFNERTIVNRELKAAEAQFAGMPEVEAPDNEMDITTIIGRQTEAAGILKANQEARGHVEQLRGRIRNGEEHITGLNQQRADQAKADAEAITRLERQLAEAKDTAARHEQEHQAAKAKAESLLAQIRADLKAAEANAAALKDPNLEAINAELRQAEETNRCVRARKDRQAKAAAVADLWAKSESLTARLEEIDAEKAATITAAKMPVAGLGFDDNGVTLAGLPFDQASQAEQIRASAAIAAALNPKLRVMLIRDGSLLDRDSLAILAEMAEAHDMQVWLERVTDGQPVGIVIEDGEIKNDQAGASVAAGTEQEHPAEVA